VVLEEQEIGVREDNLFLFFKFSEFLFIKSFLRKLTINFKVKIMHRKDFIKASLLTFGALTLGRQKILAAFLNEPWKITMLTDNIGIFTEKGGTIAFHFSKEGITVIDAQFPDSVIHLIDELKKRNDKPFHLLVNTHHHGDHTSGNIAFKDLVNRVIAHENSLANQKRVATANHTEDKQLFPNETFANQFEENLGDEKISMHYFGAGHTNGDAVIHFTNANIAHVGDLVFNGRHPVIDRSAGANIKSWINVLDAITKKFDQKTIYVCGHAGANYQVTGSQEILLSFKEYLQNLIQVVSDAIKAGKSKEDILKITVIPSFSQFQVNGIERTLQAAFEELNT
jgi:glyoxylase-like metal-dependent hydrolase (beta-lactamase superfamily II)